MEDVVEIGTLSPEEYWEWRTSIAEWQKAEEEFKNRKLLQAMMEKDMEISKLKINIFKRDNDNQRQVVDTLKKEYSDFKEKLEEKYKINFSDCIIGPDFSIKQVVKEDNKPE